KEPDFVFGLVLALAFFLLVHQEDRYYPAVTGAAHPALQHHLRVGLVWDDRSNRPFDQRNNNGSRLDRLSLPHTGGRAGLVDLALALDSEVTAPFAFDHDLFGVAVGDEADAHGRREISAACRHAALGGAVFGFFIFLGG